ncbi:NAD(P)/FAD-dependent oxidoreductase [Gloeobacter morelensis]|uniref:NAD(P)/FAD-dependent oxidoreductase n=1 Tax=Gloeobacter morelensis MG652769 TaxID=2781736 RepID=A0ABY3PKC2_9CYAN|nr:NAD(P)/FAD-dependent oxidoreductase [Gloeobacter morelensis]UFP94069.1 NAD(P)/FAD-dependent oxidoreductase [Gloeobacter morelensis MG652769]
MTEKHVVVIGAGPAGLTAAYELSRLGVGATILERSVHVGGISRTASYKGFRFDIGGHRFFSKSQEIEDLWSEVLGARLLDRGRLSRIFYRNRFFDYPIRPLNALVNLGPATAALCVASYLKARVLPPREVRSFEDWTVRSFGRTLYEIFFKTYTEKVWGMPCSEISADWAAQRIKGLSMASLLRSMLLPKPKGRGAVIKTLIDRFRYPGCGPGEMWETVARLVTGRGHRLVFDAQVERIERGSTGLSRVWTADGRAYAGSDFLSTMPLRELVEALDPPAPSAVQTAARALGYRDFLTVALIVDQTLVFPDNWIYIHDPTVKMGRIQNFKNWSPEMVPDTRYTCLGLEYFCFEGDGLWSAPDSELVALGCAELAKLGLVDPAKVVDGTVVRQAKAYPVYDDHYRENVEAIRAFLEREAPNVQLIGRNGMHRYNNQDHAMMTGLLAARNIAAGGQYNLWAVNADAQYQEEIREGELDGGGRLVPERLKT